MEELCLPCIMQYQLKKTYMSPFRVEVLGGLKLKTFGGGIATLRGGMGGPDESSLSSCVSSFST